MDNSNKIEIGDTVEAVLKGKKIVFTLVSTISSKENDVVQISIDSPLGKSVYGKKVTDFFKYELPSGELRSGKIINITKRTNESNN